MEMETVTSVAPEHQMKALYPYVYMLYHCTAVRDLYRTHKLPTRYYYSLLLLLAAHTTWTITKHQQKPRIYCTTPSTTHIKLHEERTPDLRPPSLLTSNCTNSP